MPVTTAPSYSKRAVLLYRGHNGWMIHGINWSRPFVITGVFDDDPAKVMEQNPDLYWDGAAILDCQDVPDQDYVPFVAHSPAFDPTLRAGHILRLHQLDPLPFSHSDPPLRFFDTVSIDIHIERHKTLPDVRVGIVQKGGIKWD